MLCSSIGINYEDLLLSWVKSKSNIYFVLVVNLFYYARRRWLSRCFVSQRENIYAFLVSLTHSAICGGDIPVKTIIFFRVIFWTLVLKNSTLQRFAYVWQVERDGIIGRKFDRFLVHGKKGVQLALCILTTRMTQNCFIKKKENHDSKA